jgi:hypothetical protein
MSEQEENSKDYSLIEELPESISTDYAADLKSGIYNLFITLFNQLTIEKGPEESVKESTQFLDEISYNFKQILDKPN